MNFKGCYPTMITPFTEENKVDYKAIDMLVEWYIANGADGIFAVCQSSEMFYLSKDEQIKIARHVVQQADSRIPVVASGHIEADINEAIDGLGLMSTTGVDAVVLVSNRLTGEHDPDEILQENADKIFNSLPNVIFGLYECPYPYLKLISDDFIAYAAKNNKLKFLKDVSCSIAIQKRRAKLVEGSNLALFNANTATLLSSLTAGYHGYNGVMANFHIDLYHWLYENYHIYPEIALKLQNFLTLAAVIEARAYPVSAKYYQNLYGVNMSTYTRSKSRNSLNENAIHEIESLKATEDEWRKILNNLPKQNAAGVQL